MRRNHPLPLMAVLLALLLLLVILGWLQYRWVGQVSESHRERLQANLQREAARFGEDFDRELARAYLCFQIDTAMLHSKSWQNFAQRYAYWSETAPYPQIVKDILLVDNDEGGKLQLLRFNQQTEQFETSDWPPEMRKWQERFAQQHQQVNTETGSLIHSRLELVAEDIPAVIIPVSNVSRLQKQERLNITPVFGYTIVRFDRDYLRQQFIPHLAHQHFFTGNEPDYNLLVVKRQDPQEVVYQSDPQAMGLKFDSGDSDATVNIFGVQLNSFLSLSADSIPGGPGRLPLTSLSINILRPSPGDKAAIGTNALGSDNGQWMLLLKHRAGSLGAAVARLRTQNLIISLGILLLLGLSVVMIMLSAQRAQHLAEQQMEFVTGVSHELRTPLAVIYSAGENLADGVVADPQQVRRYGEVIRREGRRLTAMVEQVMEFAGMQSRRKAYRLHLVEVSEIIERALTDYQTLIAEQGFVIEKHVEPDMPPVMANASALTRAIQNLLDNAMKYSDNQRLIKLEATTHAGERGDEVLITVTDEGLGIASSDLPHIFKPFYRGRDIVTAQIHGNGLGLSLLQHVVSGHGGKVTVESIPGRGSAFTIHLPTAALGVEAETPLTDVAEREEDVDVAAFSSTATEAPAEVESPTS